MQWFRRNIRTGSRLALFALALQFVLSFGHFHFDAARAAASIQSPTDVPQAQNLAAGERQQPTSHDENQPLHEPCAICAVMSMANQIAFAPPAVLPLPDIVELHFVPAGGESARVGTPWPAFQSRAPPFS
ncbi:MAG: hypothetical protein R3D82_07475 [Xanthobacteraceae bacterium]